MGFLSLILLRIREHFCFFIVIYSSCFGGHLILSVVFMPFIFINVFSFTPKKVCINNFLFLCCLVLGSTILQEHKCIIVVMALIQLGSVMGGNTILYVNYSIVPYRSFTISSTNHLS